MKLSRCCLIALSLSAVGCPLLVDDHLEIVARGSAGAASGASGANGQAGARTVGGSGGSVPIDEGSAGTPGEPSSCGVSVLPEATVVCPAVCDRCELGRCIFDCSAEDSCSDRHFACPAGLGCQVECAGKDACNKAVVACPAGFDCDLACSKQSACKETRLQCSSANCTVTCAAAGACEKTAVVCADAQCGAKCPGLTVPPRSMDLPQITCGSACACNPC